MAEEKDIIPKTRKVTGENIVSGVLLLAFFLTVCVVDSNLWRGVTTAKYFYFTAIICFALPVSAYLSIRRKKIVPPVRTADIAVGLFITYAVVHRLVIGGAKDMHWWLFLLMIPLYVIIRTFAENKKTIRILTTAVLIAVLVETLWGILQLCHLLPSYHSAFPITGSLFNPAPYAGFLAASMPLSMGMLLSRNCQKWERVLGCIAFFVSLVVLPFTGSRAAWLAALAGGVAVAWFRRGIILKTSCFLWHGKIHWRIIQILVAIILTVAFFYGIYHLKKDSADGRLFIWEVSASIVKEHPVIGVGTGRFAAVYGQAQADYFLSGKGTASQIKVAEHPDYAFNEYMHIAVELGLTGLILFLLLVALCISPYAKRKTDGPHSLHDFYFPSLITMLVFAFFSYPFDVLPLTILFVTFLAIAASATTPVKRQPGFRWNLVGCLVLLALIASVAVKVLPRWQSYRNWQEAHQLFRSGNNVEALDEFISLYDRLKHEDKFLMEYARCLSHLNDYWGSNLVFKEYLDIACDPEAYNYMGNNHKAMGQYEDAEKAYIRSSLITPNRHYPEYLLMKLYQESGRGAEAVGKARRLLDKPIKVNSQIITLIRQEAIKILESDNNGTD